MDFHSEAIKPQWFCLSRAFLRNVLDIVCVLIGIVDASAEIVMLAIGLEEKTPLRTFTVMRVLRVVRIVRVVRAPWLV